jgi:hypothetical protein
MRQSLIFSRRNDNATMTEEDILFRAPAVFENTKAERLTERYQSLNTGSLIPVMADYGYFPVQAAQKRAVKGQTAVHKAHMIAFAKPADEATGDVRSEIIMYNSHDGSSAVKLFAGAYRFICSNGIVAGEGLSRSVYHTKKSLSDFEAMLRGVIDNLPHVMQRFDSARQVQLDAAQRYELAKQAVMKRWQQFDSSIVDAEGRPIKGSYAIDETIRGALGVQRDADNLSDAFTVWNRIQENVLRGNVNIKSISDKNIGIRKARPITAVAEHVRINSELFDLLPS